MKTERFGGLALSLILCSSAFAQNNNLTRADVTEIKATLVAVQTAMGGDPAGYLKESEEFYLPTESTPAREQGKFWPVTSSVTLRYTDRAVEESAANAEQAAKDFEARYLAALASGDPAAIERMTQEMLRMSSLAATAGTEAKEDMNVYVQLNMGPNASIDPDAVVFERPGVIALRDLPERDRVVVYLDPVGLAETETLSSFNLGPPNDGVSDATGIYNVMITLSGAPEDIETFAQGFDTAAILAELGR